MGVAEKYDNMITRGVQLYYILPRANYVHTASDLYGTVLLVKLEAHRKARWTCRQSILSGKQRGKGENHKVLANCILLF